MLSHNEYLNQFIEQYMFRDIETMIEAGAHKESGRLGYPLLMTVCAGIEGLGEMSLPLDIESKPQECFAHYWSKFLVPVNPGIYENEEKGRIIYRNIRHGLAHRYITKGYAIVSKGDAQDNHMLLITLENLRSKGLWIDAEAFARDFMKSYDKLFKPWFQSEEGKILVPERWLAIDRDISSKDFIEAGTASSSINYQPNSHTTSVSTPNITGDITFTAPPV